MAMNILIIFLMEIFSLFQWQWWPWFHDAQVQSVDTLGNPRPKCRLAFKLASPSPLQIPSAFKVLSQRLVNWESDFWSNSGRPPATGWAKQGRSCRRCSLPSTPSSRTRASPTLRRWRRTSTCSRASESSTLSQPRWQSSESHGSNNLGAGGRICWVSLSAPISVRTLEVQTGHPKNWFAYTLKIEAWCSRMRFWEILFNERFVPGSLTDQHRRGRQDLFWKI